MKHEVGEQVGDGEACDKYIVDPDEFMSHPIDTLISGNETTQFSFLLYVLNKYTFYMIRS